MAKQANSQSFFSKSRVDNGLSQTVKKQQTEQFSDKDFETSPKDSKRQRMNLSTYGRANTLSVFDGSRRLSNQLSSFDQSSLKMSIMNVRIVNDSSGLPDYFDVDKAKDKWLDSKSCQLWDSKFGLMNSKHHCRRCGRCIWSKWSMQLRPLCKSSDKKHRVWDRWDFKLDNLEFENTYRSVLTAEDEIIDMHEYK